MSTRGQTKGNVCESAYGMEMDEPRDRNIRLSIGYNIFISDLELILIWMLIKSNFYFFLLRKAFIKNGGIGSANRRYGN